MAHIRSLNFWSQTTSITVSSHYSPYIDILEKVGQVRMSITKPLTLKGSLIGRTFVIHVHASHIIKSGLLEYARSSLAAEIRSLRERNCYVRESLRIRSMQYVSYSLPAE